MTLRRVLSALVLSALTLTGCSKDPEVAKREFMESGDRYVAEGKMSEAIIEYRNAVQQDPLYGEARVKLAAALRETGDVANALRESIRAADVLATEPKLGAAPTRRWPSIRNTSKPKFSGQTHLQGYGRSTKRSLK
jgi:Flp pilus assembly protein TadD